MTRALLWEGKCGCDVVGELLKRPEMEKLVHVHCRDLKVSQACGHTVNACGSLLGRDARILSSWTRGIEFRKSHTLDGGRPVPLCCLFPMKMNLGTSRIAYQFVIQGAARGGVWCKQQEHTNLLDCDPFSVIALNAKRKCWLSSEAYPEN